MANSRVMDVLIALTGVAGVAGCGDDEGSDTGATTDPASSTTGGSSDPTGNESQSSASGSSMSTSSGETDSPQTTGMTTSMTTTTTTDPTTTTGEDPSTDSGQTGGIDTPPFCEAFGELAVECYMGEYGYTAEDYAGFCAGEIEYYADMGTCADILEEWYSCLAELDCAALMANENECSPINAQFEKMCLP